MMVASDAALRAVVESALHTRLVAMDTEFVWERTFYPQLGIIQFATSDQECYLIDVLTITDFSPLARLFESPEVEMIFHDALQDLTILSRLMGVTPRAIFDTRLAAGFAGLRSTLSLRDVVMEATGVNLAKTESRTNWLKRPLHPKQIEYAIDDVRYLFAVREDELEKIDLYGNRARLEEDLLQLEEPALYRERQPHELYLRVKGAGDLSRDELAVLRELAALREEIAMERNLPRPWITPDYELIALATHQPTHESEITIQKGSWAKNNRDASRIIEAIERGIETPPSRYPEALDSVRDSPRFIRQLNALMRAINQECAALHIDPQLLSSRANVKAWLRSDEERAEWRGWRAELIKAASQRAGLNPQSDSDATPHRERSQRY